MDFTHSRAVDPRDYLAASFVVFTRSRVVGLAAKTRQILANSSRFLVIYKPTSVVEWILGNVNIGVVVN